MGLTRHQWQTLPDDEKTDLLAYEIHRSRQLKHIQQSFIDKIDDDKPIDVAAYVDALIAGI